jgi:hypothetical protein
MGRPETVVQSGADIDVVSGQSWRILGFSGMLSMSSNWKGTSKLLEYASVAATEITSSAGPSRQPLPGELDRDSTLTSSPAAGTRRPL